MINEYKRIRDVSWDFSGESSKISIHGIHNYPAMMIPQIAERLIKEYGTDAECILDPFVGSGTVLVEALRNNINSYGVDINPLAILISKVKTTPIHPKILQNEFEKIKEKISTVRLNPSYLKSIETPKFFNIEYWFKPKVITELSYIKTILNDIHDEKIRDFFKVSFSETVRKVSNTRNGEYKLFRMPENKLKNWNPDTFKIFLEICERNIALMGEFYSSINVEKINNGELFSKVYMEDIRGIKSIPKNSIDLVITSPPYGDSKTTVAYGQFSRLSLQWLDFDYNVIKNIDKMCLGGNRLKTIEDNIPSKTLYDILNKIKEKDEKRALDVYSFFVDFYKVVDVLNKLTKDNATICMVVGNRTVKKVNIPMDIILSELFEYMDFMHLKTIVRAIPSKRLPKKSSPSNKKGDVVNTMNYEYIVILKKE